MQVFSAVAIGWLAGLAWSTQPLTHASELASGHAATHLNTPRHESAVEVVPASVVPVAVVPPPSGVALIFVEEQPMTPARTMMKRLLTPSRITKRRADATTARFT